MALEEKTASGGSWFHLGYLFGSVRCVVIVTVAQRPAGILNKTQSQAHGISCMRAWCDDQFIVQLV